MSPGPEISIEGNPAFVFPVPLPAPRFASRVIARRPGQDRPFQETQIVRSGGRIPNPRWVLVVFDGNYIRSTFLRARAALLPKLLGDRLRRGEHRPRGVACMSPGTSDRWSGSSPRSCPKSDAR